MTKSEKLFKKLGYELDNTSSEHCITYKNLKEHMVIYIDVDVKSINAYCSHLPCGLSFEENEAIYQCIKENS